MPAVQDLCIDPAEGSKAFFHGYLGVTPTGTVSGNVKFTTTRSNTAIQCIRIILRGEISASISALGEWRHGQGAHAHRSPSRSSNGSGGRRRGLSPAPGSGSPSLSASSLAVPASVVTPVPSTPLINPRKTTKPILELQKILLAPASTDPSRKKSERSVSLKSGDHSFPFEFTLSESLCATLPASLATEWSEGNSDAISVAYTLEAEVVQAPGLFSSTPKTDRATEPVDIPRIDVPAVLRGEGVDTSVVLAGSNDKIEWRIVADRSLFGVQEPVRFVVHHVRPVKPKLAIAGVSVGIRQDTVVTVGEGLTRTYREMLCVPDAKGKIKQGGGGAKEKTTWGGEVFASVESTRWRRSKRDHRAIDALQDMSCDVFTVRHAYEVVIKIKGEPDLKLEAPCVFIEADAETRAWVLRNAQPPRRDCIVPCPNMAEPLQKVRATIASNSNQQLRTVALLSADTWHPTVLAIAKNKLKIKKPARIFIIQPHASIALEVTSPTDFRHLTNDGLVLVSGGEDYIGKETVLVSGTEPTDSPTLLPGSQTSLLLPPATVRHLHAKAPVEPLALAQLTKTSHLPGMVFCVGMPDLHAGNDYPIGAVFAVRDHVYPALIGGDIGCGMSMYALRMKARDVEGREHRIAAQLTGIEGAWDGDVAAWLADAPADPVSAPAAPDAAPPPPLEPSPYDRALGTVGRGNHFAELQVVDRVFDDAAFERHGLDSATAYLLVHSGSRGLGKSILESHTAAHGKKGLSVVEAPEAAAAYLRQHDGACRWARRNRELIARRVFGCLGLEPGEQRKVLDVWHNHVEVRRLEGGETVFLHRKGAAPSDRGLIAIPGSRGTVTYVVEPLGGQEVNGYSVAHGAGREMTRTRAQAKVAGRFANRKALVEGLSVNAFGGVVVCEDVELLCEEAPEAYKDVDAVVEDLVEMGCVRVVATMKPAVTYKMRKDPLAVS
ncbi:hypothetical protein HDU96_007304 [Phlyctochytrium bullatum]|nr:hypothetical protein HDU96_007304 [Phlyctochytrium bullatum]